ncbi:MAG TPA: hypothetical protein IAC24_03605 [Candidatus Onthousia faecigallinarum]|nr:hypothetical protein [Candidatus Onthousia faecigallinarum]
MKLWHYVENHIEDQEFHFDIFADKIHVVNYQDIISVGNEKIILSAAKQTVYFYGTSFSLSKLLDQELLIEGKLLRLEVIYE